MMQKLVQKRSLRTYQTDRYGNIRPLILMNELQSIADDHAEMLGVGRTYCMANNIAWVVTHYLIDIVKLPREGEELIFASWPAAHDALRAVRDFEIRRASDNELLVRATSQWIIIDVAARRPLRISEHLPGWGVYPGRAYDRAFEKFPDFEPQKTRAMSCRYDDIDVNQHINNAVYAVWATENVGFEFRNTHKLRGIELNFKKEIAPDMPGVTVDTRIEGNVSRHKIRTDTENANIVCRWE
jgi:acyl-ACP thioesterase